MKPNEDGTHNRITEHPDIMIFYNKKVRLECFQAHASRPIHSMKIVTENRLHEISYMDENKLITSSIAMSDGTFLVAQFL